MPPTSEASDDGVVGAAAIASTVLADTSSLRPVVDWEEAINLETTRTQKEPSSSAATQQHQPSANYFDDIYRKISEYYSYQLNNNGDVKDLAASNELMNYYQMLRAYYEQSMGTTTVSSEDPIIDLTISKSDTDQPNSIKINIESDEDARCSAENNITISRSAAGDVSINVQNTGQELKISCKTTPPKKRYISSNNNHCPETITAVSPPSPEDKVKFCVDSLVPDTSSSSSSGGGGRNRSTAGISVRQQLMEYRQKQQQLLQISPIGMEVPKEISPVSTPVMAAAKPITSTYLQLMRSMGLADEDALKFDQMVSDTVFF